MSNEETFYRLTIRFTNGETEKFIVRDPLDSHRLSEHPRYAIVRVHVETTGSIRQVLMAAMSDVSYIRTSQLENKDIRQRVAGIAGSMGDEPGGPEELASLEFV
ncbi:MAG TPA: hypothetical protein PLF26_17895 [Blastocatellia bacterium]|nr:hypothetical protein [Blastocatellia bacterium]